MTAKLLAETIGTFVLVLTIGLAGLQDGATAPIAIGLALTVAVYAGGPVSGAHFNPAVTVAAWMRGALPAREMLPYMVAQFTGGLVAAFLVYKFLGVAMHVAPKEGASALKVLTGEAIFTFILAWVVLSVATVKAAAGNSYFGLAIGGTVTAGAFAMGPITGGAFNPAVGLAPAIIESMVAGPATPLFWVYVVGPVIGAAAAATAFKYMHPGE